MKAKKKFKNGLYLNLIQKIKKINQNLIIFLTMNIMKNIVKQQQLIYMK